MSPSIAMVSYAYSPRRIELVELSDALGQIGGADPGIRMCFPIFSTLC